MLPAFLIVGTMKGGTSALARALKQHPDVFIPDGKEVRYFDIHFAEGPEWYESRFEKAPPGSQTGDASPGYMYGTDVIDRMTEVLPEARYLAILRDPIDRAYSHYWHNVRREREARSFLQAIEEERAVLAGELPLPAYDFAYLDRSRYLPQLKRIEARVGRDRMLILKTEDLRTDRSATLRAAWEFMQVDPDAGDVSEPSRPLVWHMKSRLSAKRRKLVSSYPPVDHELRSRLLTDVVPEITLLESWWGRDLSDWKH